MLADLRYACRSLSRSRLFTTVSVLVLAIGIGANVSVFSLVNAVALRPLPFRDADRLVDLHETSATQLCEGCSMGTSREGFTDLRTRTHSFAEMGAYLEEPVSLSGEGGDAERAGAALVSAGLFEMLGSRPLLGRTFAADEDRAGGSRVVVLGEDLWRSRFGGDAAAIGRVLRVNGVPHTVIGVMPAGYHFPEFARLWLPMAQAPRASTSEFSRELGVIARLAPGATLTSARAELASLSRAWERERPAEQREWMLAATPLREQLASDVGPLFNVLFGAVTLVLLVVCGNIAGLLLARGAARRPELAVRLALGASRRQLIRQLLAESVILAAGGGALGFLLSLWGTDLAVSALSAEVPYWIHFGVDVRVLAYVIAIVCLSGLVFGLVPALRATRVPVQQALKDGALAVSGGRSRLRGALVIGQLALALVLLAGAGVLMKSFVRISSRDWNPALASQLGGQLEFLDHRYDDDAQLTRATSAIVAQVSAKPGVRGAFVSYAKFVAGFGGEERRIRAAGVAQVPAGASPRFAFAVTPAALTQPEVTFVEGRAFTDADQSERVMVINARMARALWPSGSAIGHRIALSDSAAAPWFSVIGVIADDTARATGAAIRSVAYVPFAQLPGRPASLQIRANGDPLALIPSVRRAIASVDPDLPIASLETAAASHRARFWPYRLYALFMGVFAAIALVLAAIGVYGVVAYATANRTRELGVRMALGASGASIVRLVTLQGAWLALGGVAIGIAGAFALLRVLRSMIFGMSPFDPMVFALVSITLAGVCMLASWVPARRAARLDPTDALRHQ
ncbi:MAG: permease [Gemmatimonadetes bacterium]|nr:permease [Gemmatimonadota bacterium]